MRPTTLTHDWKTLQDAAGGVAQLADALGMSQSALYRAARGLVELSEVKKLTLELLCDELNVPNPLNSAPRPFARDLKPLRMAGEALARGFPLAPSMVKVLRRTYPDAQLIKLAEADDTSEEILLAVQALLEDAT